MMTRIESELSHLIAAPDDKVKRRLFILEVLSVLKEVAFIVEVKASSQRALNLQHIFLPVYVRLVDGIDHCRSLGSVIASA